MEGIIILILTLVTFVVFAIVFVTYGRKFRWPEGHRFEAEFAGNKAILIVDKEVPTVKDPNTGKVDGWLVEGAVYKAADLVHKSAVAIHATELAFKEKHIEKANVDQLVVHFQTDHNFENPKQAAGWWNAWSQNVAAYSATVLRKMWGSTIPLAVVRAKHMKALAERGQPIIHELVHILNKEAGSGYSHEHEDADLWSGPGGVESAEAIGARQWKDLV